jgi:hypothetical protein
VKVKSDFHEENLYPLWENFCKSKSWSEDLRLQGLFAGKLNLFEGPDFQGAEFELDGKIYHGDVEIHRHTNDWYHHHHHLDQRYNSVRLHLVWKIQPEKVIYTSNDRTVFTLDINKLSDSVEYHEKIDPCYIADISSGSLTEKLKILSIKRLNYKITRIKDLVNSNSYDQVLFTLLMRILGSPNNATNFEYLASLLPWEEVTKIKKKNSLSIDQWIKFYLHMSGLKSIKSNIINESDDISLIKLIRRTSPISYLNWQTSGQRPHNNPIFHLAILANWFSQFSHDSLYYTLKKIIIQRLSAKDLFNKLHAVLSIGSSIQKESNNKKGHAGSNPTWGRAKITEIIGNAFIPYFYWEALVNSSFGFQEYLEDVYFTLPQLNQYAKLEEFRQYTSKYNSLDKQFYANQGLLYLHQHYCLNEACDLCPLTG